jgi:molybdate transport system ATP-binding protein
VTHDLAEAALLGDAVVTINRGRLDRDWFGRQLALYREERAALLARFDDAPPAVLAAASDDGRRSELRPPKPVPKEERPCDASS